MVFYDLYKLTICVTTPEIYTCESLYGEGAGKFLQTSSLFCRHVHSHLMPEVSWEGNSDHGSQRWHWRCQNSLMKVRIWSLLETWCKRPKDHLEYPLMEFLLSVLHLGSNAGPLTICLLHSHLTHPMQVRSHLTAHNHYQSADPSLVSAMAQE